MCECVNSAVEPSFKVVFAEKKSTYRSHEQCTEPTKKKALAGKRAKHTSQTHAKTTIKIQKIPLSILHFHTVSFRH